MTSPARSIGSVDPVPSPDPESTLPLRLRRLGLRDVAAVRTHRNRVVLLSLRRRVLRLHAGYAWAPDDVLAAIVRYLRPWSRRATRDAARRVFLEFPVHLHAPARPRRRALHLVTPGDNALLSRLADAHRRLNREHFGGELREIPFRISRRMRRRLGDVTIDSETGDVEIGINQRHAHRDPWSEVEHTLLHEMVHQWQAENGLPLDHGASFRHKAREVGVLPRASRPYAVR